MGVAFSVTSNYPSTPLRVANIALRSEFGDVRHNLSSILHWIGKAADAGADLVCFPEIALQGYCSPPDVIRQLAERPDGSSGTTISEQAAKLGITVSVGMSLIEGDGVYNAQAFFGPDGYIGAQHKVHLCGCDRAYDPGNSWEVFSVGEWCVGSTICFDSEFPEAARILALKGAQVLLMSFATGRLNSLGEPAQPEDWRKELMAWAPSRAYDNRIFVVGVNHGGEVIDERGYALANPENRPGELEWAPAGTSHRWPGYLFGIDPLGQIFSETDRHNNDEKMLVVDLDPVLLEKGRSPISVKRPNGERSGHFLEVRRVDTFEELVVPHRQ